MNKFKILQLITLVFIAFIVFISYWDNKTVVNDSISSAVGISKEADFFKENGVGDTSAETDKLAEALKKNDEVIPKETFVVNKNIVSPESNQKQDQKLLDSLKAEVPKRERTKDLFDKSKDLEVGSGSSTITESSPLGKKSSISELIESGSFASIISFGLALYAFFAWFTYFASFSPGNAFTAMITPALATFLAFQWKTILQWFQI